MPQTAYGTRAKAISESGQGTSTVKGERAAMGPDYDKIAEQKDWDDFKKERKLPFSASRAKFAKEYGDFRAARAKSKGQAKALEATK